ncbi:MAG: phosphoribosylaminoimidazolesuccinocarboxamide synthase [Verrucomicrobiota bacterium]|jgi:phosphoribosylaminoimidazole-succinocarboxamide synthase|nr:phosphoribosylaminoimidazolesuccinocarboxamide synthase [Verrucomicrobiota bacterium]HCF96527.1 phosphoribosylaminoimidazolesuccinocarboxamide synthase [Verrucomicrobiota bacterium]
METLFQLDIPVLPKIGSGKVREIFDMGDELLIVSSDRVSAFDCILPNPIPFKGPVLTGLSKFWFELLSDVVPHHLLSIRGADLPDKLAEYRTLLNGRFMLVRKARPLAIECVVRGYLAGSGWKDYTATGEVCGHKLPSGLRQAEILPTPIFTPATKATTGHDENITRDQAAKLVGQAILDQAETISLKLYKRASAYAAERGIILADTKFEFGLDSDGTLIWIDEAFTPDSSRFWPKETYEIGTSPVSMDKQFVRDYLEGLDWDKTPPAPELPPYVIEGTTQRYLDAYQRLTGIAFALPE